MDYEIKILLNRLIEAIDSPDEWTIALTIANTIAVIGIAIVQIRMQKRQTKLQEHDMYKKLYSLIYSIHDICNSIIRFIAIVLIDYDRYKNEEFSIQYLQEKKQEIDALLLQLKENKIELELKANMRDIEYINYESFLWIASYLIGEFVTLLKDKEIHYLYNTDNQLFKDKEIIDDILTNIENSKRPDLKRRFDYYVNLKSRIAGYNILSSLKEHCIL